MAGERAPRETPQKGPSRLGPTPEWDPAARRGPEHARGLQPPKDDPLTFISDFVTRSVYTEQRFAGVLKRIRDVATARTVAVIQLPKKELLERARTVDQEAKTGRWRHESDMFVSIVENDQTFRSSMERHGSDGDARHALGRDVAAPMTLDEVAEVLLRADLASRLVRRDLVETFGHDPEQIRIGREFDDSHPEVGKASLLADEAIRAYAIAVRS